jgi:hypothetical protein
MKNAQVSDTTGDAMENQKPEAKAPPMLRSKVLFKTFYNVYILIYTRDLYPGPCPGSFA